jgi:hypothetical protein
LASAEASAYFIFFPSCLLPGRNYLLVSDLAEIRQKERTLL